MKATLPHGDTYDVPENSALYIAIGAANYWRKVAKRRFDLGFLFGAGSVLIAYVVGYWIFF